MFSLIYKKGGRPMKQSYFLQSNIIGGFRTFFFFILLFPSWGLGNLFAQIGSPYPDNVYQVNCYTDPDTNIQWGIRIKDSSAINVYARSGSERLLTGDIDGDDQIEIVTSNQQDVVIYDYQLREKIRIPYANSNFLSSSPLAIADVDNDGIAEIFFTVDSNTVCCKYDGRVVTYLWSTNISFYSSSLIIADVNADGIPDILAGGNIYNAQTGELEVILPYCNYSLITSPIFADMDNDGILEIAAGNAIIKINITNSHDITGNSAYIWKIMEPRFPFILHYIYHTAVADIDLDGFMDVMVSGCNIYEESFTYIWSPYTDGSSVPTIIGSPIRIEGTGIRGFSGSPLIADLDNDGYPEIAFATMTSRIQAYRYNVRTRQIERIWQHFNNNASPDVGGSTGMTGFDFNQDGNMEIVYRDETHLRIINGETGENLSSIPCPLYGIYNDYPIIVDLDKDGAAEIVISVREGGALGGRIFSFTSPAEIRWAPSRSVWNQYSHNVVHINEDLTVPRYQFNPVTPFINPNTGIIRRPFNHFMQQVGPINQYGEPFVPTADVTFIMDSITVRNSCDTIQIGLLVYNRGEQRMNAPFQFTTYKNEYGGDIIQIDVIDQAVDTNNYTNLLLNFSVNELNNFFPITNLVFAINDAGTGIGQSGRQQAECDTNNNILITPFSSLNFNYTQLTASICQKEPFVGYGFNLPPDSTASVGIFHFYRYLVSINRCDSIVNLELTVHPAYITEVNAQACNAYVLGDSTYTESGDYVNTLGTITGCDSVINLYLTILDEYNTQITAIACNSFTWNDQTYTEGGGYMQQFTSIQGCDSVVYLDLIIFPNSSISITDTIYKGDTYNQYGFDIPKQEEQGVFTFQQYSQNQWGCDSTVNLILHVIQPLTDHSSDLDFPNAFMPNNASNAYFCVRRKRNVKDLKIQIYSRWGELVYQSSDLNFRWDGRDRKGTWVPTGSYVYLVEYHSQTDPNITKQKKGSVNVTY